MWWHVYPLGFLGADPSGGDRSRARTLDDIAAWLGYAVDLGASGLALGPIFQSATHGYDTVDYLTVDERLGDRASFTRLVEQCRERGLRLLLDGVFNHVGAAFPAFERVRSGRGDEAEARWFSPTDPHAERPGEASYRTFEGHPGLIELNHSEPAVADFVTRVMTHWLDAGADGWRLDAAYAMPRSFWAEFCRAFVARTRTPTSWERSSTVTTPRSCATAAWTR